MNRNCNLFSKVLMVLLLSVSVSVIPPKLAFSAQSIIIDHTCTDISQIPAYWLEQAKQLTIHYAHTSHGSQINSGILNLGSQNAVYSVAIRTSATAGLPPLENPPALRLYDGNPPETYITPDDYWDGESGKNRTRAVVGTGDYGFSMWSWCGQVSDATQSYIQNYLDSLNQFENEYPAMRFIYMTGHLDGTGSGGNLHIRNEQIRNYCIANNKVLFDFADIERYDPDGTDYLDHGANDNCDYSGGNWADKWCATHPDSDLCASCSCAHSKALNCNRKARAFWWMMARLAGWNPSGVPVANLSGNPTTGTAPLEVSFTDSSAGDIDNWSWTFGDGGTSTEQSPTYIYDAPGTYTVTLEVEGPGGSDTESKADFIRVWSEAMRLDVEAFVTRFYQMCLGRNPDQVGLESWANALLDGSLTGSDVALGFVFSEEFISKRTTNEEYLQILYEAFFNRQPDSAGFQGWLDALNSSSNREYVLNGFIYANEFNELCNESGILAYEGYITKSQRESVKAFVTRFYQFCLDRNPDAAGLEGWTNNLLNQIQTGADAANGFIYSKEFIEKNTSNEEYLNILYNAFFNRDPDQVGWDVWLAELSGGKDRGYVLDGFLYSQEFSKLCSDYGIKPY